MRIGTTRRFQPQLHQRNHHPQHRHRTRRPIRKHLLLQLRKNPRPRRRQRLLPHVLTPPPKSPTLYNEFQLLELVVQSGAKVPGRWGRLGGGGFEAGVAFVRQRRCHNRLILIPSRDLHISPVIRTGTEDENCGNQDEREQSVCHRSQLYGG